MNNLFYDCNLILMVSYFKKKFQSYSFVNSGAEANFQNRRLASAEVSAGAVGKADQKRLRQVLRNKKLIDLWFAGKV